MIHLYPLTTRILPDREGGWVLDHIEPETPPAPLPTIARVVDPKAGELDGRLVLVVEEKPC